MKRVILFSILIFSTTLLNAQPPKEGNSLRVMSYNVRNGIGMDNVMDIDRVANAVNRAEPDIVALQELDSAAVRTNGMYVVEEIAKRTLMHYIFAPTINYQGGRYGVGMLSKEKPLGYKITTLPRSTEARAFLLVEFENYFVGCTHIGLEQDERIASVPIIVDALSGLEKPVFWAGDMNSTPDSPEQKTLQEHFNIISNPKQNTFPADKPDRCIDYIYVLKEDAEAISLLSNGVIAEPMASDHRPVYADLRFKTAPDKVFRTKPYLQNPTANGITVSWLTNVPSKSWVEYWQENSAVEKKANYVDGQMVCNNTHHKIRLENLEPGRTYHYRVHSCEISHYGAYKKDFGPEVESEVYSFRMPSLSDTGFTAIIFNDIHKNNGIVDRFGAMLDTMNYDFVVFNGDCIDDPKNEADAVRFLSYMCEKAGAESVPVIFTRGNHEIRGAYSIELRALLDYVGDKTYSAFNWGDTRFVLLDCGEDKPDDHREYSGLNDFTGLRLDQVDFLKTEVKSKEFRKAKRRVLIDHIPVFGNNDRYNPCRELWSPVLEKAPFDIGLHGHTHRFAYHTAGSDAGNPFPVVIGGGNKVDNATMMVLCKNGSMLTLTVYNTDGTVKLKLDL